MDILLSKLLKNNQKFKQQGSLSSTIPALSNQNPNLFGVCIKTLQGETYRAGDYDFPFTLQSISKVFSLLLALMDNDENRVFSNIGMEPTGELFDSISKLETFNSLIPLNPMVNPGAIAITSMIHGKSYNEKFSRLKELIMKFAQNPTITIDEKVYDSEKNTADKNRAIAYFLRNIGAIKGNVDMILEIYFKQCSLRVTCEDLAHMGKILASTEDEVSSSYSRYYRIIKTFMFTCGLYNESGKHAVEIGMPSKSGISGGIMASVPGKMGIGIFSPPLNNKGNPIAGMSLLKDLARELDLRVIR